MDKKDFLPIEPFRGWVLQNFPFIEADFDALTNYQLWCKIVEYVNKIAYNEELLEDSNDELIDAFNELKTYVDNYFDNLDVQEEIDNKLDEMTTDGTFTNLITPIVNAYLDNIDFDTRFSNIENDIDGLESRMDTAESNIGTLSNLGTTNKSNLVSAINEVNNKIPLSSVSYNYSENTTIPNDTLTNVGSIELVSGTYIVVGFGSFGTNTTGYRQLSLGTVESGGSYDRSVNTTSVAVSGTSTTLQVIGLFDFTTNTTVYLKAKQNSGSNVSFSSGGLRVIKIK